MLLLVGVGGCGACSTLGGFTLDFGGAGGFTGGAGGFGLLAFGLLSLTTGFGAGADFLA